jgi:hypothetical protein
MSWSEVYENLDVSGLLTTFLLKKGAISKGNFLINRVLEIPGIQPLVNEWRSQFTSFHDIPLFAY